MPAQILKKKTVNKPQAISAKERRRIDAEKRKVEAKGRRSLEKRVALLESDILELEQKQTEIIALLADPESYADKEKAKELQIQSARTSKRLQEKNYEWERLVSELTNNNR